MTSSQDQFVFNANSEEDTFHLGAALADSLPVGANVALIGTLGAGKTRLVQAVATALGVPTDEVTSPTFVLINQYQGRLPIIHFDAYRLRDEDEFLELGVEEYFESDAVIFVEWADRFSELMPPQLLQICIEPTGETARCFTISSTYEYFRPTIQRLRAQLAAE